MRKFLLAACLLTISASYGHSTQNLPHNTLLSFEEWKELAAGGSGPDDYLLLTDGTKIYGHFIKLPVIYYSFAHLEFDVKEILAVRVLNQQGAIKLQYITRNGQNYIGNWRNGKFVFTAKEPVLNDQYHLDKEIDPRIISLIVLKNRDHLITLPEPELASLELTTGDQLPIKVLTNPIWMTDGWKDSKASPQDLVQLCFDGGLHGTILENGSSRDLGFLYVKDQYVQLEISHQHHLVKLPWNIIAGIQFRNGGFKREYFDPSHPIELASSYDEPELVPKEIGSFLTLQHDYTPDSFGNKGGHLLDQAMGSLSVSPGAIAKLETFGHESLVALQQMFKEEDEPEWLADVTFEEVETEILETIPVMQIAMVEEPVSSPVSVPEEEGEVEVVANVDVKEIESEELEMLVEALLAQQETEQIVFEPEAEEPEIEREFDDIAFVEEDEEFDISGLYDEEKIETQVADCQELSENDPQELVTLTGLDEIYEVETEIVEAKEFIETTELVEAKETDSDFLWGDQDIENSGLTEAEQRFVDEWLSDKPLELETI
jgi:hypothetical protein